MYEELVKRYKMLLEVYNFLWFKSLCKSMDGVQQPVILPPIESADPRDPRNLQVSPGLEAFVEEAANEYYWCLNEVNTRGPSYQQAYNAIYLNDNIIWPIQYVMAGVFVRFLGLMTVFAKKGFGKTILALQAARMVAARGENCLIAIPTSTIANWWNQTTETGLMTNKAQTTATKVRGTVTQGTNFFMFDPKTAKDHMEYLEAATPQQLQARPSLVIIAKDRSLLAERDSQGNIAGGHLGAVEVLEKRGGLLSVIVDEGHMDKHYVSDMNERYTKGGNLQIVREMLMSGSKIDKIDSGAWMKTSLIGKLPTAKWLFYKSPTPFVSASSQEWYELLGPLFRQLPKVVVSATKDTYSAMRQLSVFAGAKEITGSGKTLETSFAKPNTRTILHLTTKQGKGLNLNGDAMMLMDLDELSIDSVIQAASRLLRPNNKRSTVYIIAFYNTREQHHKAYYASAFTYHGWELGYDKDATAQMVAKALVLIRAMGQDISLISTADKCVAMANYLTMEMKGKERLDYILAWHTLHTAALPEETSVLTPQFIGAYTE